MSKLGKLTKAIQILIKKPYLLNKVLNDDGIHKTAVTTNNPALKDGFRMLDLTDVIPNFNASVSPFWPPAIAII